MKNNCGDIFLGAIFGGGYMSASMMKIATVVGDISGNPTINGTVPLNLVLNIAQLLAIAGFLIYLGRREEQWRQHLARDFNEVMMLDWIIRTQGLNTKECMEAHGWRGASIDAIDRRQHGGVV